MPDSATLLHSYPDFAGDVWELYVSIKDFLQYYGIFMDVADYEYEVRGTVLDADRGEFASIGTVTLRGHVSGDA